MIGIPLLDFADAFAVNSSSEESSSEETLTSTEPPRDLTLEAISTYSRLFNFFFRLLSFFADPFASFPIPLEELFEDLEDEEILKERTSRHKAQKFLNVSTVILTRLNLITTQENFFKAESYFGQNWTLRSSKHNSNCRSSTEMKKYIIFG